MTKEGTISDHVATFGRQRDLYVAFATKLEHLLVSLLQDAGVQYHVVESRAKTVDSFKDKLSRKSRSYDNPLAEMPDLCGCRIITYYTDEISSVGHLLKREFDVVEEELTHQPDGFEADRFGYLSAHYVVKLAEHRARLAEWRSFSELHAEVQVRTVIQHAWSAVSHASQYKQETSVPSILQRRLYRIAGLFELADEEFVGIRDQRLALQEAATMAVKAGSIHIPLTTSSIYAAVENWPLLDAVQSLASSAGFIVEADNDYDVSDVDESTAAADIYSLANKAGINTIASLLSSVDIHNANVFKRLWIAKEDESGWTASNEFLFYLMLMDRYREFVTFDSLVRSGWSRDIAKRVIAALNPIDLDQGPMPTNNT